MAEVFLKLGEQLNSSVFVLLLMLVATGYDLLKIGGWVERFAHLNQKIDGALSMKKTVIRLEQLTELIYHNTLKNPVVGSRSPICLTPIGEESRERIGLDAVLQREFAKLSRWVQEKSPQNAYDIQVQSIRIATDHFISILNDEEVARAKSFAYAKGIRLEDLASVLGVMLCNEILKKS